MRSLPRLGALLALVLLCSPAWARPSLKGQIKGEREHGRLTAIAVGHDFTMTRGGKLLLNRNGSPGVLQSLGAYRITSVTPTADGRFEIGYKALPGTPLDRMTRFMERLGRAPRIAKEKLPVESFGIGARGAAGPGEIGQIKVQIRVQSGQSYLQSLYAKELVERRGFRTPSFDNFSREPAGSY